MLTPPDTLSDVARDKWHELAPQLLARRPDASEFEADQLAMYCTAFALRELALLRLAAEPLIIQSPNGAKYANPHLKVIEQAERTMDRCMRRLGMADRKQDDEAVEELDLS
jgi:P27 family predicted phage terminase small subunit